MKSLIAAAAIIVSLSAPAFASECPSLIKNAEEAMKAATLDDAKTKKIMEHIATAKAEHEAGKHVESIAILNDALKLIAG